MRIVLVLIVLLVIAATVFIKLPAGEEAPPRTIFTGVIIKEETLLSYPIVEVNGKRHECRVDTDEFLIKGDTVGLVHSTGGFFNDYTIIIRK